MATDKKHIAVYLDPAVEQALIAFCQEKGLISKKGTMFSAGVNAALAAFFGIADIDNILQSSSNTPSLIGSNIPNSVTSNTPTESIDAEVLPGKSESGDSEELPNKVDDEVTERLQNELGNLRSQLETLQTAQLAAKFKPPEAPDLLNRLKAKRKKVTASLADIEAILGILEE